MDKTKKPLKSTNNPWNTYSSSSQYFFFLLLWLGSHTNKLIRTFQQSVTKWWLFSVTKWSLLLLVVQYKGVLGGGKRTNNQMILMTYPSWWFNKWSGWRDLNSDSTSNSQIINLFCKFNELNSENITLFELPNLRIMIKISLLM